MQDEPHNAGAGRPHVDPVALRRARGRIDAAAQAPWLHAEAARRMAERLPLVKLQPQQVLDWSGPAGASSALLHKAYPRARQQLVMDAPAAAAARRWWQRRAATPECVTADGVGPGACELLWSNLRLHAERDPQTLFDQWHRALAVGGFLMFSTLGPGTLLELQDLYRSAGWGDAYAPFVDMHDLGDMLVHAGFADPVMDQETLTLTWPDTEALLLELRSLGANVASNRFAGLRTPRWRDRLAEALRARAVNGRPALTFELVYGHAFRGAPRLPVQSQTTVALDDLRAMIRSSRT